MKGLVSFHPVSIDLYERLFTPLIVGEKVNPESYLADVIRVRANAWQADRYVGGLKDVLENAGPPSGDPDASLWRNLRTRMERIDYRPDPLTRRVIENIDPDLHLEGRPFFITEGSAEKVAGIVDEYMEAPSPSRADALALDQLVKLNKELAGELRPLDGPDLSPDFTFRRDLLAELKNLYDLANAARTDRDWKEGDRPGRPAMEVLLSELPFRTQALHARAVPFWCARDVDGLDTVCGAAGVEPPDVLVPPLRLFVRAFEDFPELKNSLRLELEGERSIGAFATPEDVPQLLEFVVSSGAAIIRVATQHGEGPACTVLLKKIRECLAYAAKHGMGYLEGAGILPPHQVDA